MNRVILIIVVVILNLNFNLCSIGYADDALIFGQSEAIILRIFI